ncbi:MAG: hypothetical protein A2W26_03040 [Acidobacteria bacterium RBG_16_64_8]|nr:MAG: hypothetical protein A2W26_03040 [Acidobacteria bacterium RBG_16_64_8]
MPRDELHNLVFFVDHSLGTKQLADALRNAGCAVELHDDHFPPRTKDTDWLAEVARRGWIVLSKDFNIGSNALERVTLFECGVRAFLLSQQDLSGPAQVTAFLQALRRMRNIARSEPPPFIARVSPSGDVRVLTELKRAWKRSRRAAPRRSKT